ncbi:hypothetical protein HW130_03080 [Streptomyces sp. PKU-EA00015]|uniref:hypothetical protein n=1 Tax=Streptomyces sp. PKU-EA00015 TaxID=2748326 RepID=UPI0015A2A986|nr:hypothetical protein [Streptomyces sp. PKU-EA00015]NWF25255.1 hypothetical protein [Streptomyces sp. PKU-EA00015]
MRPAELYTRDLVFEHEAVAATGVPGPTIRQWARRGKIQRFQGNGRYSGQGHEYKTMYALPEIEQLAANYRPMPQRAPKAA